MGARLIVEKLNNSDSNFVSRWHSDFKHASKDNSLGTEGKCHLLKFIFGVKKINNYNTCWNKISNWNSLLICLHIFSWCHIKRFGDINE